MQALKFPSGATNQDHTVRGATGDNTEVVGVTDNI